MTTSTTRPRKAARSARAEQSAALSYQSGFGNEFATEALTGALPVGQNSPQRAPYGLVRRTAVGYRVHGAARRQPPLVAVPHPARPRCINRFSQLDQLRILSRLRRCADAAESAALGSAADAGSPPTDFVDGLVTMAGNGDPPRMIGCGIHVYAANRSMDRSLLLRRRRRAADRAAAGTLALRNRARAHRRRAAGDRRHPARRALPRRAARRPRRAATSARTYGALLRLPDLGPIGSNGLANPRDFLTPRGVRTRTARAHSSWSPSSWAICGRRDIDHSPLDVVAWHGNYAPYKYDLRRFNAHRLDQLRSSRPVDLPGAAVAERYAGRGQHRLRRSFRRAGWSWSTRSVRRGSTATSPASSWDSSTARTTPRPKASCPAARACTTA